MNVIKKVRGVHLAGVGVNNLRKCVAYSLQEGPIDHLGGGVAGRREPPPRVKIAGGKGGPRAGRRGTPGTHSAAASVAHTAAHMARVLKISQVLTFWY